LIGFGRIPQLVVPKARSFGLTVIASDPFISIDVMRQAHVESVPFDDLLARSDYISIHVPLSPGTRHLIDAAVLNRMKPTAHLINTARGSIVDEQALIDALTQGRIAGAALDVVEQEPPVPGASLLACPNLILTPHTAFYSEESLVDLQTKAAEEVVRVLTGQTALNPVNSEVHPVHRS